MRTGYSRQPITGSAKGESQVHNRMKILAVSLADDSRRFVRGYPPKGARLLLNPDLEIAGLMTRAAPDRIIYQDEKVEVIDLSVAFDWALLSTDFWQESRIREVAQEIRQRGKPVVLFGPIATSRSQELMGIGDAVVVGNILNVWGELRADAARNTLRPCYRASHTPVYGVPDLEQAAKPEFDPDFQCLRALIGCRCLPELQPFCRQYLYHRELIQRRGLEELVGEVCSLRRKHVYLLDEDVAQDTDFYREFFSRVWRFKREWTVLAGEAIFRDVSYIRFLAKAGVRVLVLTESWLNQQRLLQMIGNRRLIRARRNQVRLLHRQRLLVGARISLFLDADQQFDYEQSYEVIKRLGLDFLLVRMFRGSGAGPEAAEPLFISYQPGLLPDRPTWWKSQFYGLNAIFRRGVRRPVRVGFYSTLRYYFPRSFAYRQNFLEGIAYPP